MKQLLQNLKNGETLLLETPAPQAGPGRVLVRVRASAVSAGTERMLVQFGKRSLLGKIRARPDLFRQTLEKIKREGMIPVWEAVSGRLAQPVPLGYSCAGEVVEVGQGVSCFRLGDRVACAGAGYANHAEFVSVPEKLCAAVPVLDGVPYEEAAFATLATISLHGLRLGRLQVGENVAVIGLGLLGQLAVQLAKAAGARVLGIDLDPRRVAAARSLGADEAIIRDLSEEAVKSFTRGRGVDLVLIAADSASSDPLELAGSISRDKGTVVAIGAVGMTVPRNLYYHKELEIKISRSYGPGRYDPAYEEQGQDYPYGYVRWTEGRNLEAVIRLMASGALRIKPLITHRIPIEEGPRAYELISGGAGDPFLGVVLTYPRDSVPVKKVFCGSERGRSSGEKAGIGVLGAGNFAASVMLPIIRRSGVSLRGIASASGVRAQTAAERYGFVFAASDEREILSDAGTNAVVILTRHHLHAEQIRAALEQGKHVFVEKPLCLSREEMESISKAKEKADNSLLTVGFNRRFAPYTLKIKEFFGATAGPKIVRVRVAAGELPDEHWLLDPSQGGGRVLGEGCHFIDWANFVIGLIPLEADCRPLGHKPGEQDWALRLTYPDGSLAEVLYLSQDSSGIGKERYEVFAAGRSAVLEDFNLLKLFSSHGKRVFRSWFCSDKGHKAFWAAFLNSIREGKPSPISWNETLATMEAVFATRESLKNGRPQRINV